MLHGHLRALPFLTFVLSSYAAIYNNPDSLPNVKYDFVIVGGEALSLIFGRFI